MDGVIGPGLRRAPSPFAQFIHHEKHEMHEEK